MSTTTASVPDSDGNLHHFKMSPVPLEELPQIRAAELLFNQGKHEILNLGCTIKASSWYGQSMVVVRSCEVHDNGRNHSAYEFIATYTDDKWNVQRNYEIGQ